MADKSTPDRTAAGDTPAGERIAKVLSRRGVASRREAERLIAAGEVTVNGRVIDSPALNVTAKDRITVSGKALPDEEPARLWLYYKPEGLVTSAADEKGRDTVFDHLPEGMPRVMSVGRLDLNSEGLLLLTNDGELKRRLELPSTGWLRKYRVRVNGNPADPDLDPLRKGITVEGERFQPMQVVLDRVQGANAWLTVGLREGKNREIRRAMSAIGLYVNRLIRVSYGPFRLNEMQPGEVVEVKPRVLREQLGEAAGDDAPPPKARGPRAGGDRTEAPKKAPARKREAAPAALPRPVKPGDGIRSLSAAWKTAVRPLSPDDPDAAGRKRGPARSGAAETAGKTAGRAAAPKPGGRRAAPPAPRADAGVAHRTMTAPRSPTGIAPRPARDAGSGGGKTGSSKTGSSKTGSGKTGRPAPKGPTKPAGGPRRK